MSHLKIVIFFIFATFVLYGAKTDIYFGNGILTIERDAQYNAEKILKTKMKESFGEAYFNTKIGKVSYAYNQTKGFVQDILESGIQKLLPEDPNNMRVWASSLANASMLADLSKQLEAYRESHINNNNIIIVAHSQGNLFANRVYAALAEPNYMHIIHIAAPTDEFTSDDIVGWDNDLVAWGGFWHDDLTECSVRKVTWDDAHPAVDANEPLSNYAYKKHIAKLYKHKWRLRESSIKLNSLVHAFTFYMGEPLKEDLANPTLSFPLALQEPTPFQKIPNAIDGSDLVDMHAEDRILGYIQTQLDKNSAITNPSNHDAGGETDTNSTTGGTNPSETFDYRSQCSSVDFPDPIPSELEASINDIITNAGSTIAAPIVCPLINTMVKAYNLTNGGGIPSPF